MGWGEGEGGHEKCRLQAVSLLLKQLSEHDFQDESAEAASRATRSVFVPLFFAFFLADFGAMESLHVVYEKYLLFPYQPFSIISSQTC